MEDQDDDVMKVNVLADSRNSHVRRIESAVSLINGCQRYFWLEYKSDNRLAKTGHLVNAQEICSPFEDEAGAIPSILITEDELDDNWFSHEYRSSALIALANWESLYAPPSLKAYLIFQISQALIHFSADMSEEMAMNIVHEPPVGCLYDLAINKSDIKLGMVAGNLCQKCIGQLRSLGIKEQAIDGVTKILALVRDEALGRPVTFDPQEVFVVMRFTKNDENDNAWKYGIKTAIEACKLKVVRANDRVESGQILDKIHKQIKRARLVIAKVDENNLNVYYELGLAMGLEKDVLLISENSLVLNLPTDLKNWECLTYEKGNYEQLSKQVQKFLVDTYNLNVKA